MATAAAETATNPVGENNGETETSSFERINYISMNEDESLFAVGTTFGFHVFNVDPLKRRFYRDWGSSVGIIEVYKRTNIVALVGSDNGSRFSPNKLTIWDDNANKVLYDVDFKEKIVALRLRHDRIVVATVSCVHILNFKDLSSLATYPTNMEPYTLAVSQISELPIIAFPSFQESTTSTRHGILNIKRENPSSFSPDVKDDGSSSMENDLIRVEAHDSKLVSVALSRDGKFAASASQTGTIVRVWDTETGKMVKELRRGAESANVYSICFSSINEDRCLLAVASSRGTCHIFGIMGYNNTTSMLRGWGILPSYFNSEWSMMQVDVPCDRSCMSFCKDLKHLFLFLMMVHTVK